MGLNMYSDWTDEEMEAHLKASPASEPEPADPEPADPEPAETEVAKQSSGEIPKGTTTKSWSSYLDSRASMNMTKVGTVTKSCAAGWAFAAVTAMEV